MLLINNRKPKLDVGERKHFMGMFKKPTKPKAKKEADDTEGPTKPVLSRESLYHPIITNGSYSSNIIRAPPNSDNNIQNSGPDSNNSNRPYSSQNISRSISSNYTSTNQDSPIPACILDDANHITIVESYDDSYLDSNPQPNYTHTNYQERYTSFTSECISLQNSDMTTHTEEFDRDSNPVSATTSAASKSGNLLSPSKPKKNLRSLLRLTSYNTHELKAISDEDDLDDDITTVLSDSESDLNFDPKNEENQIDYKSGGYHPVHKGETYYSTKYPGREYIILRKLGWGHFSTVWLAKSKNPTNSDKIQSNIEDSYVAIKFVKSNKNYMEAAEDEIKIMHALQDPINHAPYLSEKYSSYFNNDHTQLSGYKHVMKLLDDFEIVGPHGNHICMVFEILGEHVLNLICKYKQFYCNIHKEISRKSSTPIDPTSSISPTDISAGISVPNMKFSKWDTKIFKKNTKSMLSLGLNLKATSKSISPKSCSSDDFDPMSLSNSTITSQSQIQTPSTSQSSCSSVLSPRADEEIGKRIKTLNSDSLLKIIQNSKSLGGIPTNLVRQIVKQMLLAMDYVHHCGVIHTDLKPENILVEVKDVNNIIKSIETNHLSKLASCKNKFGFRKNTKGTASNSISASMKSSRTTSVVSNNSVGSGAYKKSKNSTLCKTDCPVRSSKPFMTSISNDVFFKDVNYEEPKTKTSNKSSRSATPPTSAASCSSIAEHGQTEDQNNISIKIADLGNATFSHTHFTNQIQTRQYRSPEIILKYKSWGSSTDLWSIGCIIFELITGDYLFDPYDGKFFDKDEDHLAQIIELLGAFPSDQYLVDCKLTSKYFKLHPTTNKVILKNIDNLKFWSLTDVFVEKYKFDKDDIQVQLISDLILRCLRFDLDSRYDCRSLLNHPWLRDDFDFNNYDPEALQKELDEMTNIHDDLPGYTSTWSDDY